VPEKLWMLGKRNSIFDSRSVENISERASAGVRKTGIPPWKLGLRTKNF